MTSLSIPLIRGRKVGMPWSAYGLEVFELVSQEKKQRLQMELSDKTDVMQHQNNWFQCRFFSSAISDEALKYLYFDKKG